VNKLELRKRIKHVQLSKPKVKKRTLRYEKERKTKTWTNKNSTQIPIPLGLKATKFQERKNNCP
jgi:hypothetical protein